MWVPFVVTCWPLGKASLRRVVEDARRGWHFGNRPTLKSWSVYKVWIEGGNRWDRLLLVVPVWGLVQHQADLRLGVNAWQHTLRFNLMLVVPTQADVGNRVVGWRIHFELIGWAIHEVICAFRRQTAVVSLVHGLTLTSTINSSLIH